MANLKASKKDAKRTIARTARNRKVKSTLRTLIKKVKAEALTGNKEAAKTVAIELVSVLDKAAKRNIIHLNKASRQKADMSKYIFSS